jgi:CRP-like cAMP-binding protein/small-conductance mechanosensitive channel
MQSDLIWALGLSLAVVVSAALVNRFNPSHRPRNRRTAILFFVYLAALGLQYALGAAGLEVWSGRFAVGAQLLAAFTVVNVGATVFISLALPATRTSLPMIATDLLVGIGYIVATLGVLSQHGLNPTGALASAAVVSAVLAISLQSTLGNILGGVALQLDGSVHEGDWIQLENGRQGRVRAIRWRHTVVETRDWSTIIVPNALLLANNIMILGKRDGRAVPQRMWVWFNVDFRYPPTRVIEVVTTALRASPIDGVASDPPPNCVCMDFTRERRESFATYAVRYHLTDLAADDPTNSRVRARIFTAMRRAEIPFALPAQHAWVQIEDDARATSKLRRRAAERIEALRGIPLFRELTESELETLADGMSHAIYVAGETITRQGAVAHWLYVITSGSAEVRTHFDPDGDGPLPPQTKVVARVSAPDVFGEMGLMTGEARSADVVATSDVECFRLGKETFERVLLARPEIANALSEKLAARRMELIAVREGLDASDMFARQSVERDRILGGIKSFFGL